MTRLLFALPLFLSGCLPDLDVVHAWNDGEPAPTPEPIDTGPFDTAEPLPIEGDLVVDATSYDTWVHLDLDPIPGLVDESAGWDVRFQRFVIELNGGVSGTAGVEVTFVPEIDLSEIHTAPHDGFVTDVEDGPDENEDPDRAFDTWYDYDSSTHVLTPVPGVWVVCTSEGDRIALAIDDYYSEAGTSGVLSLRWKRLDTE